MNKLITPLESETDLLRETYAALNRNDIEAAVKPFDRRIAWIEPVEYTGGGTFHGRAAVKAHLARARGNWAEGSCEPERFIVAGDKVIVFIYVRVRLKHETEWREGVHAEVYTFCNGKATEMRIFDDKKQALEWAGSNTQMKRPACCRASLIRRWKWWITMRWTRTLFNV
jgi:uncharacterized protein